MTPEEIQERIQRNKAAAMQKLAEKKANLAAERNVPSTIMNRVNHASDDVDFSTVQRSPSVPLTQVVKRSIPAIGRKYAKRYDPLQSTKAVKPLHVNIQLISTTHISIQTEYRQDINDFLRDIPSSQFDVKSRTWTIPLAYYMKALDGIQHASLTQPAQISLIPEGVWLALLTSKTITKEALPVTLHSAINHHSQKMQKRIKVEVEIPDLPLEFSLDANFSRIDDKLRKALLPFQRDGIQCAIDRQGRILIADDMGLGKTIQALGIACHYRHEWPLLVIVPSSLRMTWLEAFREWVPSIDPSDIEVIFSASSSKKSKNTSINVLSSLVNIISYDMAVKYDKIMREKAFRIVIADESHFLKNSQTLRTKVILPILKLAKRAILLSGTPALSRPSELYPQIQAVCSSLFPKFQDYGLRYCHGVQSWFGWDFTGTSNAMELQLVLSSCVMIRRLKSEVLTQLPPKRRQQIFLTIDKAKEREMKKKMATLSVFSTTNHVPDNGAPITGDWLMETMKAEKGEHRRQLTELWKESSTLKLEAMLEYVEDLLLDGGRKILFFAHHQEILDAFDVHFKSSVPNIRIDGHTPSKKRQELCHEFQTKDQVRLAILSITAASVGLTLTAASTVVFGELYWNPGVLVQAEDRAHRIGQRDSVNVQYLLAKNTLDDKIWPLLIDKLNVLQSVGLAKENEFSSDVVVLSEKQQQKKLTSFFSSPTSVTMNSPSQMSSNITINHAEEEDDDIGEPFVCSRNVEC